MKVFKAVLVIAVLLLIVTTWKVAPAVDMAAGYLSKSVCSEHFVAGRTDVDHIRNDVNDIDSMFTHIDYTVDDARKRVSAYVSLPLGIELGRVTTVYRAGLGCTIAAGVAAEELSQLSTEPVAGARRENPPLPRATERNPRLESLLDQAFSEPTANSHRQTRAVVILHRGEIVAERYAQPFTVDTPLLGWSMTKSITNNLIGILVADGQLALDEPAPVREWKGASDQRRKITLRQLLQMSSGLDFAEIYGPGTDATNMLFTEYSAGGFAAQSGLAYPPGAHWSYSSGTTNILARIVFEQTGGSEESVYRFMQDRLFMPVGLDSMVVELDSSGAPVGSSFGYATARDWARLGQFWLQDGVWEGRRILPEGWMDFSTAPAPAAPHGEYGAQFWLDAGKNGEHRSWPELPSNVYFANGYNHQTVAVFPDQEIVVARLGFTTDDSWSLGGFLLKAYEILSGPGHASP